MAAFLETKPDINTSKQTSIYSFDLNAKFQITFWPFSVENLLLIYNQTLVVGNTGLTAFLYKLV